MKLKKGSCLFIKGIGEDVLYSCLALALSHGYSFGSLGGILSNKWLCITSTGHLSSFDVIPNEIVTPFTSMSVNKWLFFNAPYWAVDVRMTDIESYAFTDGKSRIKEFASRVEIANDTNVKNYLVIKKRDNSVDYLEIKNGDSATYLEMNVKIISTYKDKSWVLFEDGVPRTVNTNNLKPIK